MITINGETKILGLIGDNISHSKSFVLHNAALEKEKINGIYLPFQISKDQFSNCLTGLSSIKCLGANITTPFKEEAFELVDYLSEEAKQIEAINTIIRKEDQWVGYNTDCYGFWKSLKENNISVSDRPIFIWGAGGAAKSVCYALKQNNVSKVFCWNRTRQRIQNLQRLFPVEFYDWNKKLPDQAILINCTPLSKKSDYPQKLSFNSSHIVVDLLYWKTDLLQLAENSGAIVLDGSGMLIHQAAKAFSLWFPNSNPTQIMKNVYQEHFK